MVTGNSRNRVVKNLCIANQKTIIVAAALLSGVIGWFITYSAISGHVMADFKELDAMNPTNKSTFDKVFVRVMVAGFGMFAISFLGCVGAFNSNKCILFAFAIAGLVEGIILLTCAVATNTLLTASVPPIIMETNRICRNIDSASQQLGCSAAAARLLEALPESWSLRDQVVAAHEALSWADERRLDAGTTEVQLVLRIASSQNQDRCVVLADICKLPEGVENMDHACTCNGKSVSDMARTTQADMDWVCPQPIAGQLAPPECGSFCANWDGSGDLTRSWCFVNMDNDCVKHNYVNETYGPMEPNTEACQAETLLKYPWSGLVSRGIYVAQTGVILISILSALMFASSLAAAALMWYTAGNKFSEQMRVLTCDGPSKIDESDGQTDDFTDRGSLSEWTEGGSSKGGYGRAATGQIPSGGLSSSRGGDFNWRT